MHLSLVEEVEYCVLIDLVGGPDRKMFGSRSCRTDRAQLVQLIIFLSSQTQLSQ